MLILDKKGEEVNKVPLNAKESKKMHEAIKEMKDGAQDQSAPQF